MRTTVFVGVSLDGFLARKDGNIDWLVNFESEEVHDRFRKFMRTIDAVVMGRGTFEKVAEFPTWPYDKKVFVLSTSLHRLPDSMKGKCTILSMKPKELMNYFSDEGFSNLYIDGGKVIQSFLREDCIDELIITRIPILLGSGIPLFGLLERDLQFHHVRTDVHSSGLVESHYERRRS